eukprot:TRINITY_DN2410_c0_g1_i1.p1 TRINITY_DN2410_c0_g1~~TRINITY_DN2410_c0_g1_i1.p1  ORF type:complete len:356 (-),score=53.81 TRINITY_DN2410_c0_g1_i1:153-1220(-)
MGDEDAFIFSSRRRHTRFLPVSWARRCVIRDSQRTILMAEENIFDAPQMQIQRKLGENPFITDEDNNSHIYFEYVPGFNLKDCNPNINDLIQVFIQAKYISQGNYSCLHRYLWGSHPYSLKTDIVCTLWHDGILKPDVKPPTNILGLIVLLEIVKPDEVQNDVTFFSTECCGIISKDWIEDKDKGYVVKKTFFLEKNLNIRPLDTHSKGFILEKNFPQLCCCYNLSNEPCLEYNTLLFGDSIYTPLTEYFKKNKYHESQVLYLETFANQRLEIFCLDNHDLYSVSVVLEPRRHFKTDLVPLPEHLVELVGFFEWKELNWGVKELQIGNLMKYEIKTFWWIESHDNAIQKRWDSLM